MCHLDVDVQSPNFSENSRGRKRGCYIFMVASFFAFFRMDPLKQTNNYNPKKKKNPSHKAIYVFRKSLNIFPWMLEILFMSFLSSHSENQEQFHILCSSQLIPPTRFSVPFLFSQEKETFFSIFYRVLYPLLWLSAPLLGQWTALRELKKPNSCWSLKFPVRRILVTNKSNSSIQKKKFEETIWLF